MVVVVLPVVVDPEPIAEAACCCFGRPKAVLGEEVLYDDAMPRLDVLAPASPIAEDGSPPWSDEVEVNDAA